MSSLFVNNIKHTNTQDAISIDTSGNVILDKVGTGAFYRTGTFTPYYSSHAATTPNVSDVFTPASYFRQSGRYVRIGNLVNVNIRLTIDHSAAGYQNGGATSGLTAVNGLPFRVANITDYLLRQEPFTLVLIVLWVGLAIVLQDLEFLIPKMFLFIIAVLVVQ